MKRDGEPEARETWGADTLPSSSRPVLTGETMDTGPEVTPEVAVRYRGRVEIGRGGLGQVLSTFDHHLGRDVARKELLLAVGADTSEIPPDQMARFLREARVTAQLEHPNIVPVYELGRREDGTLYYTMKLVRGRTMRKALETALDLQERLSLLPHFVDLCQAIAYAHSRGVIHRDIKPDNVMIGEFGETLVLDWGVAKVRGKNDLQSHDLARAIARMKDEESARTLPGSAFGTPAYMSPEQARGQLEYIDERSDVWSLGVVLYQLLSGALPYPPGPVLHLLLRAAQADLRPLEDVAPDAPPDLAAVVRRALMPDPGERYSSAKELADEVQTFLSGGWVEAHRYSPQEVVGRWLREHKRAVLAVAVAALIEVGAAAGAWMRVLDERDRALAAEAQARRGVADALVARARLAANRRAWGSAELFAAAALEASPHPGARGLLARAESVPRADLRWSEQTYAGCAALAATRDRKIACATSLGTTIFAEKGRRQLTHPSAGWSSHVAVDDRGTLVANATERGQVEVWDLTDGTVQARFSGAPVIGLGFFEGALYVGRRGEGLVRMAPPFRTIEPVAGAASLGRGAALAVGAGGLAWVDDEGRIRRLGEPLGEALTSRPIALAVGPRGEVAVATENRELRYAPPDAALVIGAHEGVRIESLVFAGPNVLLAGTDEGEVHRIHIDTGLVSARWTAHDGAVTALTALENGFASAGADRRLRAFEVSAGREPGPTWPGPLRVAAIGAGGKRFAITRDGRAWSEEGGALRARAVPTEMVTTAVALNSEGWVALGSARGQVALRSPGGDHGPTWTETDAVTSVAFASGGSSLFVGTRAGLTRRSLEGRGGLFVPGDTAALAVSGPFVARLSGPRLELRSSSDGRLLGEGVAPEAAASLAVDRRWLAVGARNGAVRILSVPNFEVVAEEAAGRAAVVALTFEGPRLWAATEDGLVSTFDLRVLDRPARSMLLAVEGRTGLRRRGLDAEAR